MSKQITVFEVTRTVDLDRINANDVSDDEDSEDLVDSLLDAYGFLEGITFTARVLRRAQAL